MIESGTRVRVSMPAEHKMADSPYAIGAGVLVLGAAGEFIHAVATPPENPVRISSPNDLSLKTPEAAALKAEIAKAHSSNNDLALGLPVAAEAGVLGGVAVGVALAVSGIRRLRNKTA